MESFDLQMQAERGEPLFDMNLALKHKLRKSLNDLEAKEKQAAQQEKVPVQHNKSACHIPFVENGRYTINNDSMIQIKYIQDLYVH